MLQEQLEEHQPLQYSDAKSDDNIVKNRSQNVLASKYVSFMNGMKNYRDVKGIVFEVVLFNRF